VQVMLLSPSAAFDDAQATTLPGSEDETLTS
jgi:hypothetical protein